jgi:hypothetical protein
MLGDILEDLDWELPVLEDCNASTERADNMIAGYRVICERYRAAAAAQDEAAAAAAAEEGERYMRNPNLAWGLVFWFKHPYYIYCAQATATGQPLQQLPEEVWNRILPAMALTEDQQQQVCDMFLAFEELQAPYVRRRQQLMQLLSRSGESLQSLLGLRAQSGGATQRHQRHQQQVAAASGQRPAAPVQDAAAAAEAAATAAAASGAGGVEPAGSAAARLLRSSSSAAVAPGGPSAPAGGDGEAGSAGLTLNMADDLAQLLTAEFHRLAWLEFCFHYLAACLLKMPQYLELAAGYEGHLQFTTWEAKVAQQVLQRRRQQQQQQQQQLPRQQHTSEQAQVQLEALSGLLTQRHGAATRAGSSHATTSSSSIATCGVAAGVGEPVAASCWPPAPKAAQTMTGGVTAAAAAAAAAVLAQGPHQQRPPSAASGMDVDALAAQQGLALQSSGGSSSSTLPVLEGSPCHAQEHPPLSPLQPEQQQQWRTQPDQQQPRDQQLYSAAWPMVSLAPVPDMCSPELCEELPSLGMASPAAPAVTDTMDEGLLLPAAAWVSPAAASGACPVMPLDLQQQRQGDRSDAWWPSCNGAATKGAAGSNSALLQPLAEPAGCMSATLADVLLDPITAGEVDEAEHVDWAAEYLLQQPQPS